MKKHILCYTVHPANIFIELGRWLAPAMTASGVLFIFQTLHTRLLHFISFCSGKSIAVYGLEDEKEKDRENIRVLHSI